MFSFVPVSQLRIHSCTTPRANESNVREQQNDAAPATSRYLVLGDLNTSVDSEGYLKWIDGQYIEHNVCMAPDWVTSQSGLTMWLRTAIEYNNIHRYMTLPSGSKGGFLASRKFHIIHVKSNSSLKEALVVQAGRMPALGLRANTQAYQPEQRTAWGDSPHRPSPGTSAYAANTTRLRRPPSDLESELRMTITLRLFSNSRAPFHSLWAAWNATRSNARASSYGSRGRYGKR